MTVMMETPTLLLVIVSPPPVICAVVVMVGGAVGEMLAVRVMVEVVPAGMGVVRVHDTTGPIVQVQPVPLAEVAVMPVGMVSVMVMVPVVGPLPMLLMVSS